MRAYAKSFADHLATLFTAACAGGNDWKVCDVFHVVCTRVLSVAGTAHGTKRGMLCGPYKN